MTGLDVLGALEASPPGRGVLFVDPEAVVARACGAPEYLRATVVDAEAAEILGEDLLGHGGGGGGHHHHHGGGWGGPWGWGYTGPAYAYPWLEIDDMPQVAQPGVDVDAVAEAVARRLREKEAVVGYTAPDKPAVAAVNTPGRIQSEMDAVLREARTLGKDIASHASDDPSFASFRSAWAAFFSELEKFCTDTGWFSRLWGGAMDKTIAYGNQINDWRARFAKFPGARPTEPDPTPIQRREDPSAFPWGKVGIGAVVVAGIFGGGYALSRVGGLFQRRALP